MHLYYIRMYLTNLGVKNNIYQLSFVGTHSVSVSESFYDSDRSSFVEQRVPFVIPSLYNYSGMYRCGCACMQVLEASL